MVVCVEAFKSLLCRQIASHQRLLPGTSPVSFASPPVLKPLVFPQRDFALGCAELEHVLALMELGRSAAAALGGHFRCLVQWEKREIVYPQLLGKYAVCRSRRM